ncbi:MAG: hypothetical protein KGD63_12485 [Candidatus Lokiarchaeota archaeon]|nr:hypothetical protein [Candidatus Lokiarchaeota archaeon]
MKENIEEIQVKIPHRITGFFEIVSIKSGNQYDKPENIGSKGAGFTLNAFGFTKIKVKPLDNGEDSICHIYINNEKLDEKAFTSNFIYNYIKHLISKPKMIKIYHNFELPVESGYGASGAGALGLIFGLNKVLNLNLSDLECGRIAHISEVINETGLGTVCGQLNLGLSILKKAGYPCVCERIHIPKNISVITTSFGKISTKSILTDEKVRSRIIDVGKKTYQKFIKNPTIETFVRLSLNFVEKTDIINLLDLPKVRELLFQLNKERIIGSSMNQLGRSVYAICKNKDVKELIEIFRSYQTKDNIYVLKINEKGLKN